MHSNALLLLAGVAALLVVFHDDLSDRILLIDDGAKTSMQLSDDHVCMNALLHAEMHDHRPDVVEHYERYMKGLILKLNYVDRALPELVTFRNGFFAVWNNSAKSAWANYPSDIIVRNETTRRFIDESQRCLVVDNWVPNWVKPVDRSRKNMLILNGGDYVAYQAFAEGFYGHFAHDWFPTLAWLRTVIPSHVKFILHYTKNTQKELSFIDPKFLERVIWIENKQVVHVRNGNLIVPLIDGFPEIMGHRLLNFARGWVQEKLPMHRPSELPKRVVFYTRAKSSDVGGERIMDPVHQMDVIRIIQEKMAQYKPDEKLVVFNGQNGDNKTMEMRQQFNIFRSATTVIGPHGSGVSGNLIWTDPSPPTCEDRVQFLEFIPGEESAQVQCLYCSHFPFLRGWPLEYHSLLYTKESVHERTFINLTDLEAALEAMWNPEQIALRTERRRMRMSGLDGVEISSLFKY